MYQGFWILKKNLIILASDTIQDCAQKVEVTPEAALYGLIQCLGVTILDGTTDPEHMRSDILNVKKMNVFCEEGANASLVKQWLGELEQLMDDALE